MLRLKAGSLGLVVGLLLLSAPALATEIVVECPALPAEQRDELDARLRLLLRAAPGARRPNTLQVRCESGAAVLGWDPGEPERVEQDATGDLVEPIFTAIEARLFAAEPRSDLPPIAPAPLPARASDHAPASAAPIPQPIRAVREPAASGLSLGIAAERWRALSGWGVGPQLEVALGPNPVLLAYAESIRFGAGTDREAVAFDLALGAGWGAPFAARHPVGAFVLAGAEMFSKFRRVSTGAIPFAALGLRAALPVTPGLRLWVGIEGRLRGGTSDLDTLQALGSFGVFLPVETVQD